MIDTESNGRKSIRLLAMHHLQLGKSLSAVAGLSSVGDAPRCGAPRKITGAAEKWLSETVQILSAAKEGGYITGY